MLLMALPNEHLLTFNQYKDAKTFFAAIQTRFGGNDATKTTQKTLLKQMYENFNAPSTESLESIFNKLQKIASQLAILGEIISQEDLNLKFLRSLPSEWNTHVVVWRNKPNLNTMSFDDLYNNFKIVKQEVKGTANSSSSSQNMAFMSSPSSTNEVNTAYEANTAKIQVSPANTQVSTVSTQISTASISDATVYAFLANQPNGSQLVHQDLEQIHKDDLKEMDLKWQLALLSIRTRRFFQKTGRKITINESNTAGYDKSKVEYFNCHKLRHFARECRGSRKQDSRNWNQDSSKRTINVEDTSSKAMLAIDGVGFDWSYIADDEVFTNIALMDFLESEFEGYGPKMIKSVSEDVSNEVRKSPDALLVEELVSDVDKFEKKTIFPTKIEFVKQQEKLVRKLFKHVEMYRSQGPRGNQRNWNNQKSQQLGSDFVMYNKVFTSVEVLTMCRLTENTIKGKGWICYLWGGAKGGRITGKGTLKTGKLDFEDVYFVKELQFNLFSVLQMCDKKNSVLFTDTGCFVLSPDFKLADEKKVVIRTKKYVELFAAEKIQADCDMKATNIILQGLPADIYSLVNHNRVAKDSRERVQLLMQGTSLTKQERECKLYDAFDKFTHIKGESLHTYYLRFTQLINDMNIYKMNMEQFQVNTKFLNSLPPEWSKFVTDVKLVKDFHTSYFDQLHAYLEQHELHANEVRIMRERNQDPLALLANQQMTPPYFNPYQSSYNNP
ncbi:hypothetical protein Tco_0064415 [Tanacetum coccineum]